MSADAERRILEALGLDGKMIRSLVIRFEYDCIPMVEAEIVLSDFDETGVLATELRTYELTERQDDDG